MLKPMHLRIFTIILLSMWIAVISAGCAKPPTEQLITLEQDLASKHGEVEAEEILKPIRDEINKEVNKFALFRSYTKTRELMNRAYNMEPSDFASSLKRDAITTPSYSVNVERVEYPADKVICYVYSGHEKGGISCVKNW